MWVWIVKLLPLLLLTGFITLDSVFHVSCRNSIDMCELSRCRATDTCDDLDCPAPSSSEEILKDTNMEDKEGGREEVHLNRSLRGPRVGA